MSALAQRPARPADLDWLFQVHSAAMKRYVDATWGWDESWQVRHFADHFDPSAIDVIQWGDVDVGFARVSRRADAIALDALEILPAFQSRGIGSAYICRLIAEGSRSDLPVTLQVLKVNTRARLLYERLGFNCVDETATHHLMRIDRDHAL